VIAKERKQGHMVFIVLILLMLSLVPVSLYPRSLMDSPHGDRLKLPKGCASCHKGHGKYNTPMLPMNKDVFCFRCHGYTEYVENTRQEGDLARNTKAANVQREFEKPYRHPIEKIGIHRYGETLPETNPGLERHSECEDCHHHHYVKTDNKAEGIKGTSVEGLKVTNISSEYELCFNCHSYSANLPADQLNKADLFKVSNASYHPVIAPGKNTDVPSLIFPWVSSSLIKCTDCHNNNETAGPKGPHGSIYKYLLAKFFADTDGPEGISQYELCYSCHNRSSILSDESFQFHYRHIYTEQTSCKTCHNPHGSINAHLIDFENNLAITPSSNGRLEYVSYGTRAGQCSLNCHNEDHGTEENPGIYPTVPSKSSSSQPSTLAPIPLSPLIPFGR
jgi:predicted CXXCH cytochrome family protein